MNRLFLTLLLMVTGLQTWAVQANKSYYIHNTYYNRILGTGDSAEKVSLSVPGKNTVGYVWTVEESSTDRYVYLRQKETNRYLAASTSNTWGILLSDSKGTGNQFLWRLTENTISNRKAMTKYVGVDAGQEANDYIGIYYDKPTSDRTQWRFIEAVGTWEESLRNYHVGLLQQAIDLAKDVATQRVYASSKRTALLALAEAAEEVINNEGSTIEELQTETDKLSAAIVELQSQYAETIISGSSLDLGDSYTLALTGLKLTSLSDSVGMVLRTPAGDGFQVGVTTTHVRIGGNIYEYPKRSTMNLYFTVSYGEVNTYIDNTLLATTSTAPIVAQTLCGTEAEWSILRGNKVKALIPEIISTRKALLPGEYESDDNGNMQRNAIYIKNANITLDKPVDFHIFSETPLSGECTINLNHERAWIIYDNWKPSDAKGKLSAVKVQGGTATNNLNVHASIYLNGTAIFPISYASSPLKAPAPFVGYTEKQFGGEEIRIDSIGRAELTTTANAIRSFILHRGYMATVCTEANGKGYSRVYVADHKDVEVPVLPDALNGRISSIQVKYWQYVGKKGWCSTSGGIATEMSKVKATWYYTWSADRSNLDNGEYIPIKQHIYWPTNSQIQGHKSSTAMLMYNEPDHSEQHDNCDCGGKISEWTACTKTPDMSNLGMRVGSPAPTDAQWLYNYIGHVDDMAYRCDFVAIHAYWGPNEANGGQAWYNRLKEIYNHVKRPIWITEWNYGASWTTESWPSNWSDQLEKERAAIAEIQNVLDTCSFVERYAIYNWDEIKRSMISWDDGSVTPAGRVYRDAKQVFAYNAAVQKIPNWWAPSLQNVSLTAEETQPGIVTFTINNPNGDLTETLFIQKLVGDQWTTIYEETDRSVFENSKYACVLETEGTGSTYRLYVKRGVGGETYSSPYTLPALVWNEEHTEAVADSYITNPDCADGTSAGWTVSEVSYNKGEAFDGDATNQYWNLWKSSPYTSTMTQEVKNLPAGIYKLSALLRGQEHIQFTLSASNGITSVKNDTFKGTGVSVPFGSTYLNGWEKVTTPEITVNEGQTLTISLTVNNPSGAGWWSADHFGLTMRPDPESVIQDIVNNSKTLSVIYDISGRKLSTTPANSQPNLQRSDLPPAGLLIIDGKKVAVKR